MTATITFTVSAMAVSEESKIALFTHSETMLGPVVKAG